MSDENTQKTFDPYERSSLYYGKETAATKPLPFFKPIALPVPASTVPVNPGIIAESCGGKIISGFFIGKYLMCIFAT